MLSRTHCFKSVQRNQDWLVRALLNSTQKKWGQRWRPTFYSANERRKCANVSHGHPLLQTLSPHESVLVNDAIDIAHAQAAQRAWTPWDIQPVTVVPNVVLQSCAYQSGPRISVARILFRRLDNAKSFDTDLDKVILAVWIHAANPYVERVYAADFAQLLTRAQTHANWLLMRKYQKLSS